jgi:Cytochrome b(N-terminal)/b6/petB
VIRPTVRYLDERAAAAPFLRRALRYAFPDHWSFLLGEIALYAFVVLVATGVYLAFFFDASTAHTVYHGSYAPLRGQEMSRAYASVVDLSLDRKAGLLIRQTHHWAADVFIVAIVLHLLRIFFTGAFRKPRELTYYLGQGMLMLALLGGFLGYSLVDDLLSGMGIAIAYSVTLSVPFLGANAALLIWGAPFPGDADFWSRMYIAHVFVFPILAVARAPPHRRPPRPQPARPPARRALADGDRRSTLRLACARLPVRRSRTRLRERRPLVRRDGLGLPRARTGASGRRLLRNPARPPRAQELERIEQEREAAERARKLEPASSIRCQRRAAATAASCEWAWSSTSTARMWLRTVGSAIPSSSAIAFAEKPRPIRPSTSS